MMMVELLCGVLAGPPARFGKQVRVARSITMILLCARDGVCFPSLAQCLGYMIHCRLG